MSRLHSCTPPDAFVRMCRDGGSKIKQGQGPFPFKPPETTTASKPPEIRDAEHQMLQLHEEVLKLRITCQNLPLGAASVWKRGWQVLKMHGLCGAQNFPLRCLKFTWHCQLWPWGILDIKFSTCSSWLILVNASWWGKQASNTLEKSFIHSRSTASLLHLGIFHENKTYLVYTISYFAKPLRCWDSHPLSDLYVRMPMRSMINLMIFDDLWWSLMIFDDQLDDLWCHLTQRSTGIFGCFLPRIPDDSSMQLLLILRHLHSIAIQHPWGRGNHMAGAVTVAVCHCRGDVSNQQKVLPRNTAERSVFSYGCVYLALTPPKKNHVQNWASGIVKRYLKISTWISTWIYLEPIPSSRHGAHLGDTPGRLVCTTPSGALWRPGARWRVEEVPRHEVQSHFATFGPSRLIVLDFVIVTVHIVHGVEEGSPVLNDWVTDEVTIEVDSVDKM